GVRNIRTRNSSCYFAILDTGATHSTISSKLVDDLQLDRTIEWPTHVTHFPGLPNSVRYESVTVELQPFGSHSLTEPFQLQLMVRDEERDPTFDIPSYAINKMVCDTFGEPLSLGSIFKGDQYE